MNQDSFAYILYRVLKNIAEEVEELDNSSFCQGKNLAYYETMDIIQNELAVRDLTFADLGLDFTAEICLQPSRPNQILEDNED